MIYLKNKLTLQQPDQSEPIVPPGEAKFKGYFKISRHYLFALSQIFRTFNYTAVIIVEGTNRNVIVCSSRLMVFPLLSR